MARSRPPTRQTLDEATTALERLMTAIDAGEITVPTPRDIALLRQLQGVLTGWQEALGEGPGRPSHGE